MDDDFDYLKMEDGEFKSGFDDYKSRTVAIEVFKQVFGIELTYGTKFGIDLIGLYDDSYGAEGEDARYDGDIRVSHMSNIFKLEYRTLNIPHRKFHYWNLQYLSDKPKCKMYEGTFIIGKKYYYYRLNYQMDQMCVIDYETIIKYGEKFFVQNRIVGNKGIPEDWLCFPLEYVKIINKQINGDWTFGEYCGPNQKECEKIHAEREKLINKLSSKRAQEVYINSQKNV